MRNLSVPGVTPLRAVPARLLQHTRAENDPIATLRTRYRRVWDTVTKNPELAVRVGERLFVPDDNLDALAAALGMTVPGQAKRLRTKRAVPSNVAAAA